MRLLFNKIAASELIKNRYFAIGVALQKGVPILLVPLIVSLYGSSVYADYILLYSVVQIIAIVTGICLSQAIIPFWYKYNNKETYLGSLLMLLLMIQTMLSALAFIILMRLNILKEHVLSSVTFSVITLGYAVIYNVNVFSLNFLRAQSKQLGFFWTTLLSAGIQLLLILVFSKMPGNKFLLFVIANILALLFQTLTYFIVSDTLPKRVLTGKKLYVFSRQVLKFSLSMSAYVLIALLSLVIDKWIVKGYFQQGVFAQYVLDYQFSFGVALVSLVIGMYNASRISELVHSEDWAEVRRNMIENYWLSFLGSLGLGIGAYFYAALGGVHLSMGFWILMIGFVLNNFYAVNSNLLTAQKRSHTLAVMAGSGAVVFIILLFAAASLNIIKAVYAANVVYQLFILVLSFISVRSVLAWKTVNA